MTKPKTNPAQRGRNSAASLSIVPPASPKAASLIRNLPEPPTHLSKEAAAWWRAAVREYKFEHHHLMLLRAAGEAWDRCQQARQAVADQGLTFTDARGAIKSNPAVSIERDARTLFARLLRELNLDQETTDAR